MYPSDLTDKQWAVIQPLLFPACVGTRRVGRPLKTDVRQEVNAILYVVKTGCQWRLLPREFGAWSKVYAVFRRWRLRGVWTRVLTVLRENERCKAGRRPQPSVAIIDSQSVKTTLKGGSVVTMRERKSRDESGISP